MSLKFIEILKRFSRDESGLSAVEYGLLAAGIVVGLYAVISPIGASLKTIYGGVATDITPAAP